VTTIIRFIHYALLCVHSITTINNTITSDGQFAGKENDSIPCHKHVSFVQPTHNLAMDVLILYSCVGSYMICMPFTQNQKMSAKLQNENTIRNRIETAR